MAELASGAVSSLLGVIRNEWVLLGRVGGDVQFIREEMESMNSFLTHLARKVPPGGEHDEQVRTWMDQVRLLAQDCNNCIDLYLYRGNRDIHLGKGCLERYLRWVPWFVRKMVAQHRAALELGELKERARDVGERRLRYGVEVPKKEASAGAAASSEGGGEAFVEVDGAEDGLEQVGTDGSDRIRRALFGHDVLEDYFNGKLAGWLKETRLQHDTQCVAFVVPSKEDSSAIAREASAVAATHVKNTILVDIPALHIFWALGPKNILYYVLREIELQKISKSQSQQQQQGQENEWTRKRCIREQKREVIKGIKKNTETLKVADKIKEINTHIRNIKDKDMETYLEPTKEVINLQDIISKEPSLGVLLILLSISADETKNSDSDAPTLGQLYETIINETARGIHRLMIQSLHVVQVNKEAQRILHAQYVRILHEVFPKISSESERQQAKEQDTKQATSEATPGIKEIVEKVKQEILSEVFTAIGDKKGQQATKTNSTSTLDEDQVKKMIHEAKLEILQELKEDKSDKKQETGAPDGQVPTVGALSEETKGSTAQGQNQEANVGEATEKTTEFLDAAIKKTMQMMGYIPQKIIRQLHINGIVDKIEKHLNSEETLIILKIDERYVDQWEQTRNALSLLPKVAVVMILTKTKDIQKRTKEVRCYPPGEPIDYSSLEALYHDIVLEITSQQKSEDNYDPQILRTILDKCDQNQFCMKIFAHTLYAKPKRSKEELNKLHNTLQALPPKSFRIIAMKMLKFSYNTLPKEYQSCLLYLAIFPRGHKIRRSTLIGRWVAEGLITTDDWRWSSSVHKAEQCFEMLVTKWLVYSEEVSATGRVKSCTVGDLVHDFITEIAKKQRIVETRLSHHLARHFSIFNDIHLRGSDKIYDFLKKLSESSQWSRLKVLDLEGCQCFKNSPRYLKNICNNILLLKYLSLRGTDVTWLPSEINNLRELEVLDIQHTGVPEKATRGLLLLKLKRLLAGHTNASPNSTSAIDKLLPSRVLVPEKIEKMLDMEVLFNVKVQSSQDLKDIGSLWQLRKLGVVIEDKDSHVNKLLRVISNLNECLQSLSIAIDITSCKGTPSIESSELKTPPKVLERLSISGHVLQGQLLPLLLDKVSAKLIKVTLSSTSLSQSNLDTLSKLPMLNCLRLRHNTYTNEKLSFKDFQKLKYFLLETSERTVISFEDKSAAELKKIVLFLDNVESIAGVEQLKKLEELELNSNDKSNNSGGTTAATAKDHASSDSEPDPATAANPFPSVVAVADRAHSTNPSPSAPTVAAAINLASSAVAPFTTAVAPGLDPVGATTNPAPTVVATDQAPSTPAATTTTNPSPFAPAAADSATTNDPVPSTALTDTDATTIPTHSAPTTSNGNMLFSKLLTDAKQIKKVTLRGTMLKQDDLQFLARMPNIRCLVLLDKSYDGRRIALSKDEFPKLNLLIVDCSTITKIKFDSGSSPKLEKIIWTVTNLHFPGVENLPRLKELEFKGDSLSDKMKEVTKKHKDRISYTHHKPESQDQSAKNKGEEDSGVSGCPFIWKGKGWHRRK